jgi:hemerythrin-like domain-containing protein
MQPIKHLVMEHRLISKAVSVTKTFRDKIDADATIRPKQYWLLVDFWSTYADIVHHGKEEQLLFPAIMDQAVSSEFGDTVDKLVEEHMYLLGYIGELRRFARPMFTGDRSARERVIQCLEKYLTLIEPHIRLEDVELFPSVENLLSEKELKKLAKEFKAMDERTGTKVQSYYGNLVEQLMKEV